MGLINIILGLVATHLYLGVCGEKDAEHRRDITIAFVAVVTLIIALNTLK